ncbi:hypothetical protein NL676_029817 [Syzygium grande]|nr:hypothetical protein NL676_029817 [Syzygium grande]
MAQILAPTTQCQMRITKNSLMANPMTANTWISFLVKQKKSVNTKSFSKFRVYALKSKNNTITGFESLLNLDAMPYTITMIVEYIWIGVTGIDLQSTSRMIPRAVEYGSSTGQAPGEDSSDNIMVFCNLYIPAGELIPANKSARVAEIFSNPKVINEVSWCGIEQENTLLQTNVQWPLGWPVGGYPGHSAETYPMLTTRLAYLPGINIGSTNGEVMPGRGVANHDCSICMGRDTKKQGKGYLEDGRPASNVDPYIVTSLLAGTSILWERTIEAAALAARKLAFEGLKFELLVKKGQMH